MNIVDGTVSAPKQQTSPTRSRQAARIIKHLRQELAHEHPRMAMPTGWMIDNLVCNCPPELFNGRDWRAVVLQVLHFFREQTSAETPTPAKLHQFDPLTPLFPNDELFDEYDIYSFCTALIDQLNRDT